MQQLMTPKNVERYLKGELTWAQLSGISMEQAYAIAELGYNLLTQGKLDDAEKIFLGLIAVNPKDGYFQSVLGSILAKKERFKEALEAFDSAAVLNPKDAHLFLARAEVKLRLGLLKEALHDLHKVEELAKGADSKPQARARALAATLEAAS